MKRTYNLMLFVGLFISCVFFVASGSFLYFRLFSDLNDDKQKYRSITKVGLTDKELEKVTTLQLALLFFVPLAVSLIHSSVALYALHNLFHSPVTHSAITDTQRPLTDCPYF
ncbi:ABC transporter permease protein YxdM [compost metagenome]